MVLLLKSLLKQEHFIAYIVTHLYGLVLHLELLSTAITKNRLALTVSALLLLAPVLVLVDVGKQDQFLTMMAYHFYYFYEFVEDVGRLPNA